MGTGIAYVSSVLCGLPVTLLDSSRAMIRSLLDKDERKGKLTATARKEAEQRLSFHSHCGQVPHSQQPTHIAGQRHVP